MQCNKCDCVKPLSRQGSSCSSEIYPRSWLLTHMHSVSLNTHTHGTYTHMDIYKSTKCRCRAYFQVWIKTAASVLVSDRGRQCGSRENPKSDTLTLLILQLQPTTKRFSLASSTPVAALDLSYMTTTKFSSFCRSSSETSVGQLLSFVKVSETSSQTSQVSHADFFPFPWKDETASQPVNAWKYRIPLAFSGLIAETEDQASAGMAA